MTLQTALKIRQIMLAHVNDFTVPQAIQMDSLVLTEINGDLVFDTFKEVLAKNLGMSQLAHIGVPHPELPGQYAINQKLAFLLTQFQWSANALTRLTDRKLPGLDSTQTDTGKIDWDSPLYNRYGQVKLHRRDEGDKVQVRVVSFKVDGYQTKYPVDAATGEPIIEGMDSTLFSLSNTPSDAAQASAEPNGDEETMSAEQFDALPFAHLLSSMGLDHRNVKVVQLS